MNKTYPQTALASIRRQALIYSCACPAQVSEAIIKLRDLHDYQGQCLESSTTDATVHRRIAAAVEIAHAEMERCLTDVLRLEGWNMETLQMPADLQKRQLNPPKEH